MNPKHPKYLNLVPGKLIMMDWKAKQTKENIDNGNKSFSKNIPLLVSYYPDAKKYLIMDGHHRGMELVMEGSKKLLCVLAEHQPKIYNISYPLVTLKQFAL
jgi:hypothetical protein